MRHNLTTAVANLIAEHGHAALLVAVKAAKPRGKAGRPLKLVANDPELVWLTVEYLRRTGNRKISDAARLVQRSMSSLIPAHRLAYKSIRNKHAEISKERRTNADIRGRTDRLLAAYLTFAESTALAAISFPVRAVRKK